jgi:uncharacterized protein (TIGR03086 family)
VVTTVDRKVVGKPSATLPATSRVDHVDHQRRRVETFGWLERYIGWRGEMMDVFSALDMAQSDLDNALRRVGDDQWTLPTPCSEWSVFEVANHIVAAGDYFMAMLDGASKEGALDRLLAPDVLQPDPVSAFVAQRPALRDAFSAPGALDRIGHWVLGDLTGGQLLHGCVAETTIHTWDINRATGNDQQLDPQLAEIALATVQQLAPIFVANGFAAPSVELPADAPLQHRLVACSGRRP